VYVWTLTHGGGAARPRNEYRIQLTGVSSPLQMNPRGYTVLVGYEPDLKCFAGFDISKHTRFTGRSPSIQIPITVLHDALQNGLSFSTKSNDEIAIGFRSEEFLAYVLNAELLHSEGADAQTVELLTRVASQEDVAADDLATVTPERRRVVATVERLSRDAGFRRKVTFAYEHRCAVTRMQLRLVDAAHILPVGAQGSIDEVENGICLSPTYHRAFDRALIYLDETLVMHINLEKEQELTQLGLAGGIEDFKSYLDQKIHLPADRRQWPDLRLVREANKLRRIKL
jgi:putative restriction endonuclease